MQLFLVSRYFTSAGEQEQNLYKPIESTEGVFMGIHLFFIIWKEELRLQCINLQNG